jgi:hypothetical protein
VTRRPPACGASRHTRGEYGCRSATTPFYVDRRTCRKRTFVRRTRPFSIASAKSNVGDSISCGREVANLSLRQPRQAASCAWRCTGCRRALGDLPHQSATSRIETVPDTSLATATKRRFPRLKNLTSSGPVPTAATERTVGGRRRARRRERPHDADAPCRLSCVDAPVRSSALSELVRRGLPVTIVSGVWTRPLGAAAAY